MDEDVERKMAHIAAAIPQGSYRYTTHGAHQRIARGLRRREIEEAAAGGEITEDYPDHHYGPAALVFGRTAEGKVLHLLCSLRSIVDLITVYEPDPAEWEADLKTRRRKA
jgi:hypothetical protein